MASPLDVRRILHLRSESRPDQQRAVDHSGPVGRGIGPTEQVVEYHIGIKQLSRVAIMANDINVRIVCGHTLGEVDDG